MRYKFGDLIEEVTERNSNLKYGLDDTIGVTIEKGLIPTVANLSQTALDKFYIVRRNTFIYNPRTHGVRIGMGFNKTDKVYITSWNNVAFKVKKTAESIVNPNYLWLYFCRSEWDRETNYYALGSSTIVFLWSIFLDIEIDLPEKSIQDSIVDKYRILQDRIELKKKINDNLDEQMNALFKSWFVDFDPFNVSEESSIPNGWTQTKLGDYVTYTQGTQVPVEDQYESPADNRIRFLRIVDYTGTTNDPPRYIDKKRKNSCCNPDDILIIRYGASAGQICRGFTGVFANNLFSITPEKRLTKSFLYYLLKQSTVQSFITSVGETSSAMPALTHGLISAIPFALPDTDDYINKFSVIADKCFIQQMNNAKEIEQLLLLQNNILQSLLSR